MTALLCRVPDLSDGLALLGMLPDCAVSLVGPLIIPLLLAIVAFLVGFAWHGAGEGDDLPDGLPARYGRQQD
ncbi:hypothetical protein [Oceaniglobus trochenteri]|uniref:hypothetical protein n=1 Tax=Oceaniglobus trochenteri TaxID=2763260 RepID=UPI001CFFDDBD|nr:hypothetical protein [Oceaniglobus trochenteri]